MQIGMLELGNKKTLRDLYNLGRITGIQTLWWRDIGASRYTPVEITITDTEHKPRGAYWMSDLDEILHEALESGDTAQKNPNLPILKQAFREMADVRKRAGQPDYVPMKPYLPKAIEQILSGQTPN